MPWNSNQASLILVSATILLGKAFKAGLAQTEAD